MKLYKIISMLAIVVIGLTSCEEVIILDLKNDEPRLVIEANVNATAQSAVVILTMSNGFYDAVNLELVNNATVQLTLNDGSTVDLPRTGDGIYTANGIVVNDGDNLSISVIDGNGKVYEASAAVPHSVSMDSLSLVEGGGRPGGGGGIIGGGNNEPQFQIFTYWQDLGNVESFYRIRAIKNDTLQTNDYTLVDDFQGDGKQLFRPLFNTFEASDTVTIQLMSLDKAAFQYFSDLSAIQGQGPNGSTTPFNPRTNFNNDALGYFGVFRLDSETVIVK
jgi:hypothetical protein